MTDVVSVLGGTGALGRALALRLARSGRPVVLGSRDSARAEAAAGQMREQLVGLALEAQVDGASNGEAAAAGEIVLLATPWDASGESIAALADALARRAAHPRRPRPRVDRDPGAGSTRTHRARRHTRSRAP
jgi:predicted dinucleotide-binding enzyme